MNRALATLILALAVPACGGTVSPPPAADSSTTDSAVADSAVLDTGALDSARPDVPAPDQASEATVGDACAISCAPPPPGCRYEGPVTCMPPSCGRLVCADGGVADAPAADAPPADAPSVDAPPADRPLTDTAVLDTAPADRPGPDAPTGDGGVAFTCGALTVPCPPYTGRCGGDADCAIGFHQRNCCGDVQAIGIEAMYRAAFEAAEALCRPGYPACGCPTRGIQADDERWTFTRDNVGVACRSGRCTTFVRAM
ncbi:MAG: hypothetical protein HY909_19665 [Deltaproteobacteria bacterium]|nr:hypothetical protein [Deltaproteobacteria bacterium]